MSLTCRRDPRGTSGSISIRSHPLTSPRFPRLPPRLAATLLCLAVGAHASGEDSQAPSPQPEGTPSYAIGYELGRYLSGLQDQGADLDPRAILQGALDALSNTEPRVSEEAMRTGLDRLLGGPAGPGDRQPTPTALTPPARTRGFVDDFAALNAKRPGVVSLPSGVQYEVLSTGHGSKPGLDDRVTLSYEGRLTTGVVFDTTSDDPEPLRIRVADIAVPGLKEALLLMKEGDKWRIVVPPRMGFGTIGNNMLRKRDLIYEVELVSVEPSGEGATTGASTGQPE